MDSLLSKAQRCGRKADSLLKYGLYDDSLMQLDKSIVYLNDLKSITTCYESIQMLNVQLESIDRKMRSVAIKRSESLKKKSQIESLINKSRRESNKQQQQQAANQSTPCNGGNAGGSFKSGSKLDKDDKSVMEELSTTNAEFKKVNEYLINEIEQLKRENDYLKVELLKMHMNESLSDASLSGSQQEVNISGTSTSSNQNIARSSCSISNSSSSIITSSSQASSSSSSNTNDHSSSTNDLSSSSSLNKSHDLLLATSPVSINKSNVKAASSQNFHADMVHSTVRTTTTMTNKTTATKAAATVATGRCHTSSVSGCGNGAAAVPQDTKSQLDNRNTRNSLCNRIDLSRYINDDDDDDEDSGGGGGCGGHAGYDDVYHHQQQENNHLIHDDEDSDCGTGLLANKNILNADDDDFFTSNLSINEFTID